MKVSYKEFAQFLNYKKPHRLMKLNCNFYIEHTSDICMRARAVIKWPVYIILFLPVHIFKLFYCIWDGGLKEFSFEGREIANHTRIQQWE